MNESNNVITEKEKLQEAITHLRNTLNKVNLPPKLKVTYKETETRLLSQIRIYEDLNFEMSPELSELYQKKNTILLSETQSVIKLIEISSIKSKDDLLKHYGDSLKSIPNPEKAISQPVVVYAGKPKLKAQEQWSVLRGLFFLILALIVIFLVGGFLSSLGLMGNEHGTRWNP